MSDSEKRPTVRIHIDGQQYDSPDPTTGGALYELADIGRKRELFRDLPADDEDEFIPNDDTPVDLRKGDHFYTEKEITIFVNAEPKTTTQPRLSFDDLVKLAFNPVPAGENIMFTIVYSRGPRKNPKGSLLEGDTVRIKKGMVFDVTTTDRS